MIYPNLAAEMARKKYTKDDIAQVLDIHVTGVYRMLSGERSLSIMRAKLIRDSLFPGMELDYLFDLIAKNGR